MLRNNPKQIDYFKKNGMIRFGANHAIKWTVKSVSNSNGVTTRMLPVILFPLKTIKSQSKFNDGGIIRNESLVFLDWYIMFLDVIDNRIDHLYYFIYYAKNKKAEQQGDNYLDNYSSSSAFCYASIRIFTFYIL